ncbi:MAG: IS66 family insertion sequence element accessory protein TnpB [Gammaproteobacteria bacterium]
MKINWCEVNVYLATSPIDMRKEIDGLSTLVADTLHQSPQSASVYVFYNRQKDKVKCLWWDKNGFVLYYKRLERGRFKIPTQLPDSTLLLTGEQLSWLLAGLDFYLMNQFPELDFTHYF